MRCGNENIVRIELWHHKWRRPLAAMRRLFVWVALGAGLVAGTAQMAQAASDEAQLLRLDSYDAFMQSADEFAIGTAELRTSTPQRWPDGVCPAGACREVVTLRS